MRCPHCGKEIETQQRKAAASRWAGMTQEERAAEMSRVRKKGIKKRGKKKSATRRPNVKITDGGQETQPEK
jgi:predicted Fe-S protein YdhL (DUF1289 family)